MTKEEIILANKEFLFPSVFHYFKEPLVIARAKDQYVWDADGHQYLDFFGGIVTVSLVPSRVGTSTFAPMAASATESGTSRMRSLPWRLK